VAASPIEPLLSVTFTPDYGEMFAVARASQRYHYTGPQRTVAWLLVLGFAVAAFGMLLLGDRLAVTLSSFLGKGRAGFAPLVLMIAVGVVWTWAVCNRFLPALSARWMAQRKPPTPVTVHVSDAELRWTGVDSGMWIKWDAIERMFITPDAVCFLVGGLTHYVPRRVFADAAAVGDFVRAALQQLPVAARSFSAVDASVRSLVS
jgi:hypothetical protein